ncbi:NUDIX hydrolase [Melittangium boletus]|uniref:NUDIX hydrolase n=1 Tax=Melittangium boletus TaxID=83453 RepID=UPI003DA57762
MRTDTGTAVTDIEIIEDFSSTARCDEGFLRLRRLRCRNRRADGSVSEVYRVDVVDRPRLDAVAVVVFRRGASGLEVLTRMNLRPAAYFRRDKPMALPDGASYLRVEEIVAGLLEPEDRGEAGLRHRAAEEVREEAGYAVRPEDVRLLGAGFFVAPGILSEKVFPAAVDVTGLAPEPPSGDGSPLEEGGDVRWRPFGELLALCRAGQVPDAKTELCLLRLLAEQA